MTLEEADLKLLHDIANRRALLRAPRPPMLMGTLAAAMRRRHALLAELAQLEQQWLERGLCRAGLPSAADHARGPAAPSAQRAARPCGGPDQNHF